MSLSIGIVGLPNVGKSTLFNALTAGAAEASNYPFCTIDPNVGVVTVPDARLDALAQLLQPASCTTTNIRFIDIAGLVRGASEGEGKGNQFLSEIREVDALIHVVRCFEAPSVAHVEDDLDPTRDVGIVEDELILADLQTIENSLPQLERVVITDPRSPRRPQLDALKQIDVKLLEGVPVYAQNATAADMAEVGGYNFLTAKPTLYIANADDGDTRGNVEQLIAHVGAERVLFVCAQIEAEISQLDEEEQVEYVAEMGLEQRGIERLIQAAYRLLRLITFYTLANDKLQAWQLQLGTLAPQAAGKIHTDMEAGFIRAEVASVADLLHAGQIQLLKQEGRLRTEGRDYAIQDGDVVQFLFRG